MAYLLQTANARTAANGALEVPGQLHDCLAPTVKDLDGEGPQRPITVQSEVVIFFRCKVHHLAQGVFDFISVAGFIATDH